MELSGRILTPEGFRDGRLRFGHTIEAFESGEVEEDRWILPGFVDGHVHGAGGGDVMEGEKGLRRAVRALGARGTTTIVATTWTAAFEELERALVGVRAVIDAPEPAGARVAGAHLEGPWISPARLGAQPARARRPEEWEVERLLELAPVKVVTVAPEIEGGIELIESLASIGVRVQIGHSEASAGLVREAIDRGAAGFTHLFNAMGGFHHREAGVVGAALASGMAAELIVDGHHVGPEALAIARRCLPSWYCVSDAIGVAGIATGDYWLGGQRVVNDAGVARLEDGTLAGSASTLHCALRRLVEGGVALEEAATRVSTVPARELGLERRGRLAPGCDADLVVLDSELGIRRVFMGGRALDPVAGSDP